MRLSFHQSRAALVALCLSYLFVVVSSAQEDAQSLLRGSLDDSDHRELIFGCRGGRPCFGGSCSGACTRAGRSECVNFWCQRPVASEQQEPPGLSCSISANTNVLSTTNPSSLGKNIEFTVVVQNSMGEDVNITSMATDVTYGGNTFVDKPVCIGAGEIASDDEYTCRYLINFAGFPVSAAVQVNVSIGGETVDEPGSIVGCQDDMMVVLYRGPL